MNDMSFIAVPIEIIWAAISVDFWYISAAKICDKSMIVQHRHV